MAPTWDRLHSSGVELEILHGSGKMRLVKHGQAEEEEEESIWWTSTKHGPHKSIFDASTSYNILVQLGTFNFPVFLWWWQVAHHQRGWTLPDVKQPHFVSSCGITRSQGFRSNQTSKIKTNT